MTDLDRMLAAYIGCALWSSTTDDEQPMDDFYGIGDMAPETVAEMRSDCADFLSSNSVLVAQYLEERSIGDMGHDFWLTRNGHGAGFWDRGLGKLGNDLTAITKPYGECWLYVGDDGKVYV